MWRRRFVLDRFLTWPATTSSRRPLDPRLDAITAAVNGDRRSSHARGRRAIGSTLCVSRERWKIVALPSAMTPPLAPPPAPIDPPAPHHARALHTGRAARRSDRPAGRAPARRNLRPSDPAPRVRRAGGLEHAVSCRAPTGSIGARASTSARHARRCAWPRHWKPCPASAGRCSAASSPMPRSARSAGSPPRKTRPGCWTSRITARRRTWSGWCGPGAGAIGSRRRGTPSAGTSPREASIWVDDDGMVILRARLTPELGAVVQRALEAASDRLYQESRQAAAPESIAEEVTPAPAAGGRTGAAGRERAGVGPGPRHDGGPLSSSAARRCGAGRSLRGCRRRPGRRCSSSTAVACTFPRKRRGAWRATRRWWSCTRAAMDRRWMSGARRDRSRRPSAARSMPATPDAAFPAARPATATPITLCTGPMGAARPSTICCSSAGVITGCCMKAAITSSATAVARS